MIHYLTAITGIWLLSLLMYELLLRRQAMHRENRVYLLCSLFLGALMPLWSFTTTTGNVPQMLQRPIALSSSLRQAPAAVATAPGEIHTALICWAVYIAGLCIATALLLRQARFLYRLHSNGSRQAHNGYNIIYTKGNHPPCSFFRNIYLPANTSYTAAELDMVLQHELEHVRRKHSAELCIVLLFRIAFWFHPLVYAYWQRLRLVQEFQADEAAGSDIKTYGSFLLEQAMLQHAPLIAHSFFHSPLKNRIIMLLKKSPARAARLRYLGALMLLPVVYVCCAYAAPKKERMQKGNRIYFGENVIELGGQPADTMQMEDPATGKISTIVMQVDSFPAMLNGKKIYREGSLTTMPAFTGKEKDGATFLFERLRPMLDQLDDGRYQLVIANAVIDEEGKLAYYNFNGLRKEESAQNSVVAAYKAIDEQAEALLQELRYKPGMVNGTAVAADVNNDLDMDLRNQLIVVKNHKASLAPDKPAN